MKLTTLKPRVQNTLQPQVRTVGTKEESHSLYGYKWQQARLEHLRQHPLCVMCAAEDRVVVAMVVDHKIPHKGSLTLFWDKNNWQSLCKPHHDSHKQKQERAEGYR
jgi:5-methylcytosine-specific restriction protein A